jgi:hypothetical protein
MNFTLFRVDAGHGHERILLRLGQRVTVGRAHEADLWCTGDETLGEVHFAVEARAAEGWVTLLAPQAGPLRVNGQAVLDAALRDGDMIQAGQSQFRVTIDQPPPIAAPASSPMTPATASLPVRSLSLESGAERLTIADGQQHLPQILAAIGQARRLYVLVNFRAARQPLPTSIEPDDDLFRQAPDEIRQDNSLHLLPCADTAEALRRIGPLAAKDAAMILVTDQTREQLLVSHQLLWTWLRSPSSLNTQLTHGSSELAEKLLAGIDAILAPQSKDGALAVFAAASRAPEMHAALLLIQVQTDP